MKSERSAGVEARRLERLTLSPECARVDVSGRCGGFGVDKARNGDKVTDCPGKPLALSSRCIVGNAA